MGGMRRRRGRDALARVGSVAGVGQAFALVVVGPYFAPLPVSLSSSAAAVQSNGACP